MKQTIEQAAEKHAGTTRGNKTIADRRANSVTYAKRESFLAGANWLKEQGTIQWFEIAKDGYPKRIETKTEIGDYTEKVLVTDGEMIHVTQFVYDPNGKPVGWFGGPSLLLEPTHYAYINLPE